MTTQEVIDKDVALFVESINSTDVLNLLPSPLEENVEEGDNSSSIISKEDEEREQRRNEFALNVEDNLMEDYEKSRDTLHSILKTTSNVFSSAAQEALVSGDAKQVSALASLINSINNTTKNLVDLSEKVSVTAATTAIANIDPKQPNLPAPKGNVTNIQNNVNISTGETISTEELLKQLAKGGK